MSVIGKTWFRTDDESCHLPLFDIKCRYCGGRMIMRFSDLDLRDVNKTGVYINYVCYKCPDCAWIARFDIQDTYEYLLGIFKMRQGTAHFVPDSSEWERDDTEVKRQLQALGYMGGR